MFPDNSAFIEIYTFQSMCFGAVHYYGNLCHGDDSIILTRTFTLQEAKEFDMKDRSKGVYQRSFQAGNNQVGRFNTRTSVIAEGLRIALDRGADFVFVGNSGYMQPQRAVHVPPEIDIYAVNAIYEEFKELNTDDPVNDPEWDELDKAFFDLLNVKSN